MTHTIDQTELFKLESSHNGLTYTLTHLPSGESLFFQGDDAWLFEQDYDALVRAKAGLENFCILERLWASYH